MSSTFRRPPIWLIYAVTVTGITVNTLVAPATPDILDGLGVSRSMAGLLVAAPTLPGIVLAPVIGVLADRFGRRELLVPCLAVFGAAGALSAFATGFWMLVVLRLVQGAGAGGLITQAIVIIGDHWEGRERARLIGRNAAVLTVSLAILPTLGGGIAQVFGWRAPFLLFGLALVTAVLVARTIPRTKPNGQKLSDQLAAARPYLRSPAMTISMVAGILTFVLLFGALLTILPLDAESRFGLAAGARGLLLGLPSVTSTSASMSMSWLQHRIGRRAVMVSGAALFTVALAGMAAATRLPLLLVAVLVFGLGEGLLIPAQQDAVTGLAPASSRGTVVAVWTGGARLGQTIGPLAAAAVLGAAGARTALAACAAGSVVLLGVLAVGGGKLSVEVADRR